MEMYYLMFCFMFYYFFFFDNLVHRQDVLSDMIVNVLTFSLNKLILPSYRKSWTRKKMHFSSSMHFGN